MTVSLLLLTCLLLLPWVVQFVRLIATRPEAIPTPTWMVTSSVAFLFIGPLLSGIWSGETYGGLADAAMRIAFTSIAYWLTFTATYRLLAGNGRTVQPDGPRGLPTVFGTIKSVGECTGIVPLFAFFLVPLGFRLMMLTVFGVGFSGATDVETNMGIPYPIVILNQLVRGASLPCIAIFSMQIFGRKPLAAKMLPIVGVAANLAFGVMGGRRSLLYNALMVAVGLIWSGRRRGAAAIVVLGLAVWFVLAVFSPIFLRARAIWLQPERPGVVKGFELAIEQWRNNDETMLARADENLAKRVNTYGFWLEMYELFGREPRGGLVLLQAIAMVTPRLILGLSKYSFGASEEYLFGLRDFSNNVCLISTLDLGLAGPFVYGVVVAAIFSVIDRLIGLIARQNKYVALMAVGSLSTALVSPEYSVGTVFREFRNIVLLVGLAYGLKAIVGRIPARAAASRVLPGLPVGVRPVLPPTA